ncbi:MAG: lysozyme family protein [Candidatus Limivicinus sp.]|nr:lysozyme family protein [Candidatus Limivicinus sp.]
MERSKAKEAGRKKTIREKANALKDKTPRKAPAKEVIKQAGRYHAIETAKKQFAEAQQTIAPDQEQQPYTAIDKVEDYAGSIAHDLVQLPVPTLERSGRKAKENAFHRETQKQSASSQAKPSPKQLMRREAVKEYKRKYQAEKHNSFHHETQFEPDEAVKSAERTKEQLRRSYVRKVREQTDYPTTEKDAVVQPFSRGTSAHNPKRREKIAPAQHTTSTAAQPNPIRSTGQRQTALPRDTSAAATPKAQIIKEQGRRFARNQAIQEIKTNTAKSLSGKAAKASGDFFKKLGAAVTKAVTPSRETLLYAAGALVLILVPFVVIMGVASMFTSSGEGRSAYIPISAEVEAYRPLIRLYAAQYGIPEYEDLIAAVMMQESGGQGTDPMQCSESGYNTRYPHAPNSITDPEYSIDVGVHTLADVLNMAGVESPIDLDRISLALQGYNFGPGYISWALANYGGYSELNAIEFSDMMAARYGWAGYGDKAYVSHVLRYYPIGRSFMGEGNAAMVAVAQSQIGNVGGAPYWSWWGLDYRVEWCAIFVSWCADQCGYLDAGVLPKMEGVRPYVDWFIERGQWQGRDYEPSPGDIIFFDWESDGLADHVGIVEKVENGFVYTVEGNSGDVCAERHYTLRVAPIFGFGLPEY